MPKFDPNKITTSDYTNNVDDVVIDPMVMDSAGDQRETEYTNPKASQYWGYFNQVADLKGAILLKSTWIVGKGYETFSVSHKVDLDHVVGWGKDTFQDVLFNLDVQRRVFGDSFAEIIKDKSSGRLLNVKPLDPQSVRIVVNRKGIIKRYELINKVKEAVVKFAPEDILHISNNRIGDQIHGISDIEGLEETIKAENESFTDMKNLIHRQARPLILFKLKSDDPTTIETITAKIDEAVNKGENIYLPDDDNILSWEVVQTPLQTSVFNWRDDIRNKFYRNIGLPQIVPGAGGMSTESESKTIYYAFEQIIAREQRFLEGQILNQLGIKIKLTPPQSLAPALQQDTAKDGGMLGQTNIQPNELTAGEGR